MLHIRHGRSPRLPAHHFATCRPRRPRRSIVPTLDGWSGRELCGLRPTFRGSAAREYSFEAHLCGSCVYCDLPVRLHACSPPRLAATQLARSSVMNRLSAPAGLSPALMCALRAHGIVGILFGVIEPAGREFRQGMRVLDDEVPEAVPR